MHRTAYLDPTKYTHSEYRHGLSLRGGEQIVIQDLNISQTGGAIAYSSVLRLQLTVGTSYCFLPKTAHNNM
jgi:hypothetical protein